MTCVVAQTLGLQCYGPYTSFDTMNTGLACCPAARDPIGRRSPRPGGGRLGETKGTTLRTGSRRFERIGEPELSKQSPPANCGATIPES